MAAVVASVGLLLVPAGCGSSANPTGLAHAPRPAPPRVAQTIRSRFPGMDYLPTRLPRGVRFQGWLLAAGGYDIYYGRKPRHQTLGVQVGARRGRCGSKDGAMQTFHVHGRTVQWSATYTDQRAWLCMRAHGRAFVISDSAAVAGDDNLGSARGRSDARRLAEIVAYAAPIS